MSFKKNGSGVSLGVVNPKPEEKPEDKPISPPPVDTKNVQKDR